MIWIAKGTSSPEKQGPLHLAMFEERKRIFVDLLRWNVPVRSGRYEIDQFDDEHATYVIVEDGQGQHLGSARLLPTLRPHILDTLFPHLTDAQILRDRETFEITRFCLSARITAAERRGVRRALVSAIAVYAAGWGVKCYTGVAEQRWFDEIAKFGWDCEPLSVASPSSSERLVAFRIRITDQTIARLRRTGIFMDISLNMLPANARPASDLFQLQPEETYHAA
ncbi:acyl-homoserine-lactone synthase [Sphingobium sp.]|uniref:acyl-homoserine-lactone synthase n=1 Tax=Sphingobium sp. TaxID=1912891 RepID=UPI000DB68C09|nr:acyl-homoserine-lactone synthase [Sphingobium sp.]PZU68668.1 MAG: autoinducer synthase [Sphingobium sp.]